MMSDIVDVNTLFGPLPVASTDLTVESLLELMQRYQIGRACAVSTLGILLDPFVGNQASREVSGEHPMLCPVATLNPKMYFGDEGELSRLVEEGYCMARFFPDWQGWPIDFAPFRAVARSLARAGLPLMIDVRTPGQITTLEQALVDHSGPVIVAGVDTELLSEALWMLRAHDNWHLETSRLLAPGNLKIAVHALGAHRLLFGTAAPSRPVASALHTLRFAGLPDDMVAQILGGNARRLLRLGA
jgi:predicted TIM-barrel fold metal-dependent hydrolase